MNRRAGADPFTVMVAEVLGCENLHRAIYGQRCTDAVRAVDRFAAPRALDEIHLRSPLLQPLHAVQVEREPSGIGHLDQAPGLPDQQLELSHEYVRERSERMLEPALPRLVRIRLDRGQ